MAAPPSLTDPHALSDYQLRALRCRTDRWGIVVVISAALAIVLSLSGFAMLWEVFPVVLLLILGNGAIALARMLGTGLPIGPAIEPEWDGAAQAVCARAGLTRSRFQVMLLQDPSPNAFAAWAIHGRAVFVTSGLVQLLRGDALAQQWVLAHEVGHLLYHQPWGSLTRGWSNLPRPIGSVAALAVLGWSRAAERSADRLGLVVCASPLAATRALLALSAGTSFTDADLAAALRLLPRRPAGLWGYAAESFAHHPFLAPRLTALYRFTASPQYTQLVGPVAAEPVRWELAALGLRPDLLDCGWPA